MFFCLRVKASLILIRPYSSFPPSLELAPVQTAAIVSLKPSVVEALPPAPGPENNKQTKKVRHVLSTHLTFHVRVALIFPASGYFNSQI